MSKISVIVSVYNSAGSLESCLDSICGQTFEDLDVILVENSSTDTSLEICNKYVQKDSRFRVITKENLGLGSAYNAAIQSAHGEYISFIETDDTVNRNMYEDLYRLAAKNDADIVKSAWFCSWQQNKRPLKDTQLSGYNSYDTFNAVDVSEILRVQSSIWSAIYKLSFLKDNYVGFLETPGCAMQDISFSLKAFSQAKRIVITPDAYVIHKYSEMNSGTLSMDDASAVYGEYEEIDKFFNEHQGLKSKLNTSKLIKQFYDYKLNLELVDNDCKSKYIQRFVEDFKVYGDNREFDQNFFKAVDKDELAFLLKAPDDYIRINYIEGFM